MQLITKTPLYFDPARVKESTLQIMDRYSGLSQIGFTHSPSATDKIKDGTGISLNKDDRHYTVFNSEFEGTIFKEIYDALSEVYEVFKFRIMIMPGPSAYTAHMDPTKRLHYAVQTNENAFFLFPILKKQFTIPTDGFFYEVDTRHKHTFVNAGSTPRIHLLISYRDKNIL